MIDYRMARRAKSKWVVGRFDLRVELVRMLQHSEAVDVEDVPHTTLWVRDQHSTSGYAKGGPLGPARIHLTLPKGCSEHEALALLAHEVAHVVANPDEGHDKRWRSVYLSLVKDLYFARPGLVFHLSIEDLDARVERALKKALRS